MYQFPLRPWPEIFSINIAFTLIVLPILVFVYLQIINQVNKWGKIGIILFLSLLMPIFEKSAEQFGWFVHSEEWTHLYSFMGYLLFFLFIYSFYHWMETSTE
ncbi:MAG: hypothetical protein K6T88_21495 [Bacillus sp. (in: Bacteria)]|nr:hypothetical protein [Bacillus sp. (in: firmicutes)]